MKRIMILLLLILCSVAAVDAETYKWIDSKGVVSFTDDPAMIPSRYRNKALMGEYNSIRSTKVQQHQKTQKKKKRQVKHRPPRIATTSDRVQTKPVPLGMWQPLKGHLGGDQINPAPPSMKQPLSAPLGDQPTPTPLGMKQPKPAPLGDQPTPTPPGMKQPKPEPLGDQPTPTPLGMEQPTPAQ